MKRQASRRSRLPAVLIWLAATIVGLAGWSELLTKPVAAYRRSGSLTGLVVDLVSGRGIYDGWGEGIMFLALTVVLTLILLYGIARFAAVLNDYIDRSRVDISVLKTEITIRMLDDSMETAQISRRQIFHSISPDVTAYHYSHTPQFGRVDPASLSVETKVAGRGFTGELEIVPTPGGKGLDITEPFLDALPTSFLATYLSDKLVLALHDHLKMFRDTVATREVSFTSIGEYDQDHPRYELQFLRYPANEVVVTIDFPRSTAPYRDDIKVMRIHENAATKILPSYSEQGDRIIVTFFVLDAKKERVRIRWSNRHLAEQRAGNASRRWFSGLRARP